MKLTKVTQASIKEDKSWPGIIKCELEHELKGTRADAAYIGPPIPAEVWNKILSFFHWTWVETKSESQVRMYVNPKLKTWSSWAYPQEANLGMSARELDTPEASKQHEQFPDSQGWLYFATVHHHCSSPAFQSGTDEMNEKNQDGLHITVGRIDQDVHDLHCRFYLRGMGFEPDLAEFWDIGAQAKALIPRNLYSIVAQFQMSRASNAEFPPQWKSNIIYKKPEVSIPVGSENFYPWHKGFQGTWTRSKFQEANKTHGSYQVPKNHKSIPVWQRARTAANEIIKEAMDANINLDELIAAIELIDKDNAMQIVVEVCDKWNISLEALVKEWPSDQEIVQMEVTEEFKRLRDNPPKALPETTGNGPSLPSDDNMYGQMD